MKPAASSVVREAHQLRAQSGNHDTMLYMTHQATTQQSWDPDVLVFARKASPSYTPLCVVTSFP